MQCRHTALVDRCITLKQAESLCALAYTAENRRIRQKGKGWAAAYFCLRESQQVYDADTARKGFAYVLHKVKQLRVSKPILAVNFPGINPHLDIRQELGGILNFIDNDRSLKSLQEELWLIFCQLPKHRVIQGYILAFRFGTMLKESRLANLPRPYDEKHRKRIGDAAEHWFDSTFYIHGCFFIRFDYTKTSFYYSQIH